MNDSESVQRLARLEGQMDSVAQAVSRIESFIQQVINPIDRRMGEVQLQLQHLQEKVSDTREQTAACNESHKSATKLLTEKIDAVHDQAAKLEAKSTAGLRVAVWFCGIFGAIVFAAGSWIFAQVGKNTEVNAVQQQRIDQLEKQTLELREELRKK